MRSTNFRAVPPDTGIVHQVNIEFLGRVVFGAGGGGVSSRQTIGSGVAYPDTVVGTDSHTTMANGLGILAWGVGGIEAEAAMLGQPVTMLRARSHRRATSSAVNSTKASRRPISCSTITQMLRAKGVVGKVRGVLRCRALTFRALPIVTTIGNMSPEYGSTVAIFPIDAPNVVKYLAAHGP